MSLQCPVCRRHAMEPAQLEENLPADRCNGCGGIWITSDRFFNFLSQHPPEIPQQPPPTPPIPTDPAAPDSKALKLCPACQRFMRWYEVGHGLPFGIDKCGTCGGIWLNAGEWESLKAQNLHLKLHFVASDIWQAQVAKDRRERHTEEDLIKRLGQEQFDELRRVAAWLKNHPHHDEIAAYLREHLRNDAK